MTRVLYYAQRSPYARKVTILLAEKNLPVELKVTDLANKSPEFISISPIGKVPVLIDEDGTTLWDSTIILEYLDETYPEPSFYPQEKKARLQCRLWEELADSLADNTISLWYQNLKGELADSGLQTKYQAALDRLFPVLEKQLVSSAYLLGETWTAADISAVSALGYYTLRFGEDWQQKYVKLGQLFNRLHERESVKSTVPIA
ncbi:glutathione S-transferase [Oscillatoriales cyanobacterium USR001]|nr:glutathione S-transferase [Oscillatoriales cyanobacterium USR001]